MAWTPLLLGILVHCTGSVSSYELNQPASSSVRLGEVSNLACRGKNIENKAVHWYQQKPRQAPRLVMYDDSSRPSGIPDRFSGTNSGDTATLIIQNVLAEDDAHYYCQVWDMNNAHSNMNRWGTETKFSSPSI